jgi:hypothetical protein
MTLGYNTIARNAVSGYSPPLVLSIILPTPAEQALIGHGVFVTNPVFSVRLRGYCFNASSFFTDLSPFFQIYPLRCFQNSDILFSNETFTGRRG